MKIFKNLALAMLSLALIHQSAFATAPRYDRTIVDTQDYAWPVAFPLDPLHAKMVASGLYTIEDADALDVAAALEFKELYGIDFNPENNDSVQVDGATGIRTIPGFPATWFPYVSENQAFVVYDSLHPVRGVQSWVNNKYGIQIFFSSSITTPIPVTSGVNAGAVFRPNSLFSFGEFNYLKVGSNPHLPPNREVVKYSTTNLSYSTLNQWPTIINPAPQAPTVFGQFTVTLKLTDEDGNIGKYIGTTEIYKDPIGINGTNYLRENPVSTWVSLTK